MLKYRSPVSKCKHLRKTQKSQHDLKKTLNELREIRKELKKTGQTWAQPKTKIGNLEAEVNQLDEENKLREQNVTGHEQDLKIEGGRDQST